MPRLAELPPETTAQVRALAAPHGPREGVIPSLYLHLALWPGLLAPLRGALAPLFASGAVARSRDLACGIAEDEAGQLLPLLPDAGTFPAEHEASSLRALETFTREVIPEMVPVGVALRAALAETTGA